MSTLFLAQLVNGLQLGALLFLFAAGLTLVFGVMDVVNLAHAAFFMAGAYAAAIIARATGSFWWALLLAPLVTAVLSLGVERLVMRRLYRLGHLDHVLATFGLILMADAAFLWWFGPEGRQLVLPGPLRGRVEWGPLDVPVYRLAIVAAGALVALGLHLLMGRTRLGMLVRAAASDRETAMCLGIEPRGLFMGVFALGSGLAGLAGLLLTGVTEASVGMGDEIIIVAFVVIVIGGVGSLKGALVAALLVGMIDTLGRAYLGSAFALVLSPSAADGAAPAVASMLVYLTMALVLAFRPEGLFPAATR